MNLGDALYRHISGRSPRTEVRTFSDAVNYLVGRAGSASAAARVLGVPPSSFRHWATGKRTPPRGRAGDIVEMVQLQQRRDRLPRGRERRLRQPDTGMRLVGRLTYDSVPEPDREVDIGNYLEGGVGDRLVDAYLEGAEPHELAEIMHDAIYDAPFYEDTLDPYNDGHLQWDIDEIEGW